MADQNTTDTDNTDTADITSLVQRNARSAYNFTIDPSALVPQTNGSATSQRGTYRQTLPTQTQEDPIKDAKDSMLQNYRQELSKVPGLSAKAQEKMTSSFRSSVIDDNDPVEGGLLIMAAVMSLPDDPSKMSDAAKKEALEKAAKATGADEGKLLAQQNIRDIAFDAQYNKAAFAKETQGWSASDIEAINNAPTSKQMFADFKHTSPSMQAYINEVNKIPGLSQQARDNLIIGERKNLSDQTLTDGSPDNSFSDPQAAKRRVVNAADLATMVKPEVNVGGVIASQDMEAMKKYVADNTPPAQDQKAAATTASTATSNQTTSRAPGTNLYAHH